MKSTVLVVPAPRRIRANALLVDLDRGPNTFSVRIGAIGSTVTTHFGCRGDSDEAFEALITNPPPELVAVYPQVFAQLTEDFSDTLWGSDHFIAVLTGMGLARITI
jgi:hypothetical protein